MSAVSNAPPPYKNVSIANRKVFGRLMLAVNDGLNNGLVMDDSGLRGHSHKDISFMIRV
ncbi:MAG: hypothetical protein H0X41_03100 [Chitinophagaceae bacterium]|nr:hypothetical protein [Chitinophagaceae bacterium]